MDDIEQHVSLAIERFDNEEHIEYFKKFFNLDKELFN